MKLIHSVTVAVVTATLSGCATLDRQTLAQGSSFTPTAGGFSYRAAASTNMQEDSPGAERNRIAVLEGYLKRNAICPNGYTVTDRQVINRPKTFLGVTTLKDIIYTGTCAGATK